MSDELAFMPLTAAAEQIQQRKLSPLDYVRQLLDRSSAIDSRLHAFLRLCPELALDVAREAETALARGNCRGPLHGIPYGLKDVIDYAGLPTTANSAAVTNNLPAEHAAVTQQLLAAGAVMMGKLALHELSIGGPCFDLPWPVPVNPWKENHFAGGSSSGCAVAVAAGLLPFAIGTDTGGSVRSPAANCGVVGIKPTQNLLDCRGVMPLAYSLDTLGVLTRNVRDNALVLECLTGKPGAYLKNIDAGVKGLRIGLVRHFYAQDEQAHPQQLAAIDRVAEQLRQQGAEIREIRLPPRADYSACCALILFAEAFACYRKLLTERPQALGELARTHLTGGAVISAADYIDAQRWRERLLQATNAAFAGLDGMLTATNFDPAYPLRDHAAMERALARHSRHPFSISGHPAIAVPAGFSADNLPLSLQVVGKHFGEAMVYRIANACEQLNESRRRRPPLSEEV